MFELSESLIRFLGGIGFLLVGGFIGQSIIQRYGFSETNPK